MGNTQISHKNSLKEVGYIFQLFSNMNWRERVFKTFCFRFEYKFNKNANADMSKMRYIIGWEEFEQKMLNNFKNLETDPTHFCIYNTIKKYFELQGGEVRVFKIYMLYFPYVMHLNEMEGIDFIDLVFEKVIYNIEVEMKRNIRKNDNKLEGNYSSKKKVEDVKSIKLEEKSINSKREMDFSELKSNRNLLIGSERSLLSKVSGNVNKMSEDNFETNNSDQELINKYTDYYQNKDKNINFVRTLPIGIFREIMYVYFNNNVTLILLAFKETLIGFQENQYENEKFVAGMKSLNHERINLDKFTSKNIYKFIDLTLQKLAQKRINLPKFKDFQNLELTFDDIYVYLKLNPCFLNTYKCYEEFTKSV